MESGEASIGDALGAFAAQTDADIVAGRLAPARARLEALPAPETWTHGPALIQAARVIGWLGGSRRRLALLSRAWRLDRGRDPDVHLHRLYHLEGIRGPLAALEFAWRHPLPESAPRRFRANWLSSVSGLHAEFRDGELAESFWRQAWELRAEEHWLLIDRSHALLALDRPEEAMESVRASLALAPDYPVALLQLAHLLSLSNRDEEALDLLDAAMGRLSFGAFADLRCSILLELGRAAEALADLERAEAATPLIEKDGREARARQRSYAHYLLEQWPECAAAATAAGNDWHRSFAEKLGRETPEPGGRVHLPVAYLRQQSRTCGPATLAGLLRHFGREVTQEEITREIWYEGTRDIDERQWAEGANCLAREFRLDWDSARALLDAGIPFALGTHTASSAHLQAVIGYDPFRESFILRDPTGRGFGEVVAKEMLEGQAASGPRAMALVPRERADLVARLESASLTESAEFDALYRLRLALKEHDRARAGAEAAALPAGRAALQARRELAAYDADEAGELSAVEALLELYPHDGGLRVGKLALLLNLAREPEAAAWVERCAAERWKDSKDVSGLVVFWQRRADELAEDARCHAEARRWYRLLLRYQPLEERQLHAYAALLWHGREHEQAARIFRLSACRSGANESSWRSLFGALRSLGREAELFELLESRFRRLGAASSDPAMTLAWARRERLELAAADAVLEEGMRLRPRDGALQLHVAEIWAREGAVARARQLLEQAKPQARPTDWARAAALVADLAGELAESLQRWRALAELQPLSGEAQGAVARLLAETDPAGPQAALAYLDGVVRKFPHSLPLHTQRFLWHRNHSDRAVAEAALRELLAAHPVHAWGWRELALLLAHGTRAEEALAAADRACAIEPGYAASPLIRSSVLEAMGRQGEAAAAAREAVRMSIDHPTAVQALMNCVPRSELAETLAWIGEHALEDSRTGDGLAAYREVALAHVVPEELLAYCEQARQRRPELWQSWLNHASQLCALDRRPEAREILQQAVQRFDRLPRLWVELAEVDQELGRPEEQIASLRKALELQPQYDYASRELCLALHHSGRPGEAREVLDRAIAHAPLEPQNLRLRAHLEWTAGETARAVASLERALRIEPGFHLAWAQLSEYSRRLGEAHDKRVARSLTEARPGEVRSWLMLSDVLTAPEERREALAALDRALLLNPRSVECHDARARILAEEGRFVEAQSAAAPNIFPPGEMPLSLRGRSAWILARRGDPTTARERMREIVAAEPAYRWGWECIAEWSERLQDHHQVREAAVQLARLEGDESLALAYRADARLGQGDRAGAKEDFRAALRIRPHYEFVLLRLQQLELEDGEIRAAQEVQRQMESALGAQDVRSLLGRVRLAGATRDRRAAEAAFGQLLRTPDHGSGVPNLAAAELDKRFGWRCVARVCAAACLDPTARPAAAATWAEAAWRGVWRWETLWRVGPLAAGPHGDAVLAQSLRVLGQARAGFFVKRLLARFGPRISMQTEGWAQAVYALIEAGLPARAAEWAARWRDYPEASGWMLHNAALAQRALARWDHADIHEAALARPHDHCTFEHLRWLAYDKACRGAGEEARALMAQSAARRPEGVELSVVDRYTTELILVGSRGAQPPAPVLEASLAEVQRLDEAERATAGAEISHLEAGSRTLRLLSELLDRPMPARRPVATSARPPAGGSLNAEPESRLPLFLAGPALIVLANALRSCG